ncbi:hypothetical protein Taro_005042 [Colocasia esculenta]|uniref:Hcy-binding domain-containing protein n=1 Tax=Colocasia esculenta TaxID=4460 RepID=A0A843TM04_COLES|nr:hypothetical protein [Colocasia esculenta]
MMVAIFFRLATAAASPPPGFPSPPLPFVHLDYLEAGADVLITASYQATIQGFHSKGFSIEQSEDLLRKSVAIACEAREIFYDKLADGGV